MRRPKDERRNLNSEEMEAMGFTDMRSYADEEGWPYPDDDDEETVDDAGPWHPKGYLAGDM